MNMKAGQAAHYQEFQKPLLAKFEFAAVKLQFFSYLHIIGHPRCGGLLK